MKNQFLDIECNKCSDDFLLFAKIVNQGIDSRLEAFTESEFIDKDNRFLFRFADSEIQILLRRLFELSTCQDMLFFNENASQWENDILQHKYGYETI